MAEWMKYLAAAIVAVALVSGVTRLTSEPATAAGGEVRILQRIDTRLAQMNQRLAAIRDSLKDAETGRTTADSLAILTNRGVYNATVGATGVGDLLQRICRHTAPSGTPLC